MSDWNSMISRYLDSKSREIFLASHSFLSLYIFLRKTRVKFYDEKCFCSPPTIFHNMWPVTVNRFPCPDIFYSFIQGDKSLSGKCYCWKQSCFLVRKCSAVECSVVWYYCSTLQICLLVVGVLHWVIFLIKCEQVGKPRYKVLSAQLHFNHLLQTTKAI